VNAVAPCRRTIFGQGFARTMPLGLQSFPTNTTAREQLHQPLRPRERQGMVGSASAEGSVWPTRVTTTSA
jgi:hypothetical protein